MIIEALDQWLPAAEAARTLGVSRPRIHQLVRANVLDGVRVAGRLLVHRRSVDVWARSRRHAGRPPGRPLTMDDLKRRRGLILQLARARHASNIRIFGSVARGDARRDSDVDFLVDLDPGATALDVTGLMTDLEDELGRRADVVVIRRQSPMGRRIRAEAVPL